MKVTRFALPVGGAVLAGEQAGSGRAVVMLHAGVADRRMYAHEVAALGRQFRAVAYDRRGFGETTTPDVSFSHVEDLRAVVAQLGLGRPILVGCSQGGRIAIDFALACPDAVSALVLVGTAVSGAPDEDPPDAAAELIAALEAAEAAGDVERINRLEARVWLDGPTSAEHRVGGAVRALFLDMNGIALRAPALTRTIAPPSAWERVSEIRVPVLLVNGDLDFPELQARHVALARAMPRARRVVVEHTAHLPNLEHPQRFEALLTEFCLAVHSVPATMPGTQ